MLKPLKDEQQQAKEVENVGDKSEVGGLKKLARKIGMPDNISAGRSES